MRKLKVTKPEYQEPITEGLYSANLKEIREGAGEYGDYFKCFFEITEGEYKGTTKSIFTTQKLSPGFNGKPSKLFMLVKALTGSEPEFDEEIDLDELIGQECRILVKDDKVKDGITYQSIKEIMPS